MRYDFQPLYLLRKVMEATEAFSGIGGIGTISGRVAISVLPPPWQILTFSLSAACMKKETYEGVV